MTRPDARGWLLAAFACALGVVPALLTTPETGVMLTSSDPAIVTIRDETGRPLDFPQPVDVCRLDPDDRWLVCNYTDLAVIDLRQGVGRRIAPPAVGVARWNPTGLAVDVSRNLVYVANYGGADVLCLRVDFELGTSVLVRTLRNEALRSPEGVAITRDGARIAVADFDGKAVFLFRADGTLEWRRATGEAHGVAFLDDRALLASDLALRSIKRFDLSGRLVLERGSFGRGGGEFLWPTSVSTGPANEVAVCDPHTGRLTLLDGSLRPVNVLGGNGRSLELFNMPYHASWSGANTLLVADTFKSRLVQVSVDEGVISAIWRLASATAATSPWTVAPASNVRERAFGDDWTGYDSSTWIELEFPRLGLGGRYRLCYARLRGADGGTLELPSGVFTGAHQPYFLQAKEVRDHRGAAATILGSPQGVTWWVFVRGQCVPIMLGLDHWIEGDRLVGAERQLSIDVLVEDALRRLDALRWAAGEPWHAPLRRALLPWASVEGLERCFTSDAGRELLHALQVPTIDRQGLKVALNRYVESARVTPAPAKRDLWESCLLEALFELCER